MPMGRDDERDGAGRGELPDAALFWRWAAMATRPVIGWVLIALGGIAILLGYLGVSGEALVAKQLPYLLSGGITGMVLVAVGAFLLGTEDLRKQLTRLDTIEEQIGDLHRVLLSRADAPPLEQADSGNGSEPGALVVLRNGSRYHRPDCPMVQGKDALAPLTTSLAARRHLEPCAVCEPGPVKA